VIGIVDYGLGNLGSVANMLKRIGVKSTVTSDPAVLRSAKALILPGVGHFDRGMQNLNARGLKPVLDELVLEKKVPLLGICLGMQLLARRSEEGREPGLGWIAGDVKRFSFPAGDAHVIPHMGWNEVEPVGNGLFGRVPELPPRFYFVHSFHLVLDDAADALAWCNYGYRFAAAVHKGHIWGTQFHPEKSHKFGKAVLEAYAREVGLAA
jgi:glutamine amidotransferase